LFSAFVLKTMAHPQNQWVGIGSGKLSDV